MITLIIVAHGNLAAELLATAKMTYGSKIDDVYALCFTSDQEMETLRDRIAKILEGVKDSPVIFLTDMIGGSAFTASMNFLRAKDRYLITGANLPILLEILLARDNQSIDQVIAHVRSNIMKYSVVFPQGMIG